MYITEVKEKVEQILEQRNGVEIYFVLKKNESRIVSKRQNLRLG